MEDLLCCRGGSGCRDPCIKILRGPVGFEAGPILRSCGGGCSTQTFGPVEIELHVLPAMIGGV